MKKLFYSLVTANASGMLVSLFIFLINSKQMEPGDFYLYGFISTALSIAGNVVLFGTDNLALAAFSQHPSAHVTGFVFGIRQKTLWWALLLFVLIFVYAIVQSPGQSSLLTACFFLSLPFLFSFYFTHTYLYIHERVYKDFVLVSFICKLLSLLPILLAAFVFHAYILQASLLASSFSVIIPAFVFNSKLQRQRKEAIFEPLFSSAHVFRNFFFNNFSLIYVNASYFLFAGLPAIFTGNKDFIFIARVYVILATVAVSIATTMVAAHLHKLQSFFFRRPLLLKQLSLVICLCTPILYFLPFSNPAVKFALWSVLELGLVALLMGLFAVQLYRQQKRQYLLSFITAGLSVAFFFFVNFFIHDIDAQMLSRCCFAALLIVVYVFQLSNIKDPVS